MRAIALNWVIAGIGLIWVLVALNSIVQSNTISLLAGLVCLIIACQFFINKKASILILAVGISGVIITAVLNDLTLMLDGMSTAASLVAFVSSLYILRAIIQTSPFIESVKTGLYGLQEKSQHGAIQLLGFSFSLPLAVGAVGVLGPLVYKIENEKSRFETATWAIRGIGLAVVCSPFTVAMGTVTKTLEPDLSFLMLLSVAFIIAITSLSMPFLLRQSQFPNGLPSDFWRQTLRVFTPIFFLVIAVITIVNLTHFTAVTSITILSPMLAIAVAFKRGRDASFQMQSVISNGWSHVDREVAVFVSALIFATALAAHPMTNHILNTTAHLFGPGVLIIFTVVGISVLSMLGIHMLITTTLFLTAFGPYMETEFQLALLGISGLIGWSFGSMVGIGSPAFVLSARVFRADQKQLAWGKNFKFMLLVIFIFSVFSYFS